MSKKFTSTIAGASLLITGVGLVSRGLGFFREAAYASKFGLKSEFDIYLIGAVVPIIINTAVQFLSQNYFIPAYHKKQQSGNQEAIQFFKNTFWLFCLSSILITGILFFAAPLIINFYLSGAGDAAKEAASNVFRIFIFTIPFNAGVAVMSSYMNAEFNFKAPAVSNLFLNISIIFLVIIFSDTWGVYTIPFGYIAGSLLQFIYLFFITEKEIHFSFSSLNKNIFHLEGASSTIIFIVLIEILNQLYILIDRYFYSEVNSGGIASLNYAMVLFALPVTLFSIALSTAIFPQLSHSFNSKNHELLQRHFNRGIRIIIFIYMPVTFVFYFYGSGIISLLYERGEFNPRDTIMTFSILKIYSLSFLFYASYAVINKMIYGAGLVKQLLYLSLFVIALKIIFNILLVQNLNSEGLALATTICYITLSFSGFFLIRIKIGIKGFRSIILNFILLLISSFIALFLSNELASLFLMPAKFNFILSFVLFLIIYWINVHFINHEEYSWVKKMVQEFTSN